MKYRAFTLVILLSLVGSVDAASLCQQKADAIKHEITLAKKHHNQRRVDGLERALTEVKSGCTDAQLRYAHQQRIAVQRDKVKKRAYELARSRDNGDDHKKIEQHEHKLVNARAGLKKLESARW